MASSEKQKKFDLQDVVEDWARSYFERKASRKEKKLLTQDSVQWIVDWKKVTFQHEPADYSPQPCEPGHGTPSQTVLFNTSFCNKTATMQKYTFRAERSTRSSCSIDIEQGYTTGVEMNVKVTTPCQILEASAGFKREMTVTRTEGETLEEEMTWGTDTEIEVDPKSIAEAKLIILEEEYRGKFTVQTRIGGRVRIVFTNARDNNSFLKAVEGDVVDIIKQASQSKAIDANLFGLSFDNRILVITTKGSCHFKYGIKQMVEVDQKPM